MCLVLKLKKQFQILISQGKFPAAFGGVINSAERSLIAKVAD